MASPEALPTWGIWEDVNEPDGFEPTPNDQNEARRPAVQLIGQFLLDRKSIVRWSNVEDAGEGPCR